MVIGIIHDILKLDFFTEDDGVCAFTMKCWCTMTY